MLRRAGVLLAGVALAWGCGGSIASSPDGGGEDASASSGGSSSGSASSSSSGSGGSGVGSSTGSSSGGSSGSSSGSSGSSGGSGGNSGSSSGATCYSCTSNSQCQTACPPVSGGGTNCCDQASGLCYATTMSTCPVPVDACPSGGPICAPDSAGETPPNPGTGSTGCDDCIECSCVSQWCSCAGDSGASYTTGCLGYVNCFINCLDGDRGSLSQCAQECGAGSTSQQAQEGDTFLSCVAGSCAAIAMCGG